MKQTLYAEHRLLPCHRGGVIINRRYGGLSITDIEEAFAYTIFCLPEIAVWHRDQISDIESGDIDITIYPLRLSIF